MFAPLRTRLPAVILVRKPAPDMGLVSVKVKPEAMSIVTPLTLVMLTPRPTELPTSRIVPPLTLIGLAR